MQGLKSSYGARRRNPLRHAAIFIGVIGFHLIVILGLLKLFGPEKPLPMLINVQIVPDTQPPPQHPAESKASGTAQRI